jgi:hypothetical protein
MMKSVAPNVPNRANPLPTYHKIGYAVFRYHWVAADFLAPTSPRAFGTLDWHWKT